jgi:hydroxyacylglutathione hydrolase
MALEDTFSDIIGKAAAGLGLSVRELASKSDLPFFLVNAYIQDDIIVPETSAEYEKLANALGLDAAKLQDIAAKRYEPRPLPIQRGPIEVHTLTVADARGFTSNCHLLILSSTREALLIDPGAEGLRLLAWAQAQEASISTIAVTHGHRDHWGALETVREGTCARVVYAAGDRAQITALKPEDEPLVGGERLPFGHDFIEARLTPGHTAGGITYVLRDAAFVGDCLFAGSLGRANVSYQDLLQGVRSEILSLPEATALYPGHGPNTTVGEERSANPFFTQF